MWRIDNCKPWTTTKCSTVSNIQNGFKVSGIYPINENIFDEHEFLSPLSKSNEPHERPDNQQQIQEQSEIAMDIDDLTPSASSSC